MKLLDYLRLSFHNIGLHKTRFTLTLIVVTSLCALLLIFIGAYTSGFAVYESGLVKKYAAENILISMHADATLYNYRQQTEYFTENFPEYSLENYVYTMSNNVALGDLEYPYNLRINFVNNNIETKIIAGENFNSADSEGKIWLPQLGAPYGIEFAIGQMLPITIGDGDKNITVNPIVAGIVDGNEVFFGYVYALKNGLTKNLPNVILPPREMTYKQISDELSTINNDLKALLGYAPSYIADGNNIELGSILDSFKSAKKSNTTLIVFFASAIGAIALFSLSNSLAMSTNDNISLFVLLKTLGLKNKHTITILFVEAIITIITACLLAVGIAYAASPIAASITDLLWFDALAGFGAYTAAFTLPLYIPATIAACLTITSIFTVSLSFARISQKYTKQNLSESFI